MTRQAFLDYCLDTYGTAADYPFDEDFETAVFRHAGSRKWYALVMRISRRNVGIDSDEMVDVVNLKLLLELFGSFRRGGRCLSCVSHEQTPLDIGAAPRCGG